MAVVLDPLPKIVGPAPAPDLPVTGRKPNLRERVIHLGYEIVAAFRVLRASRTRLTHAEAAALAGFKKEDRFRDLGHVRFSDFCLEALKLEPRTARRRLALHDMLAELPHLEKAFLDGRISPSKVLALRGVVTSENVVHWVHLAQSLSVRALTAQVAKAKRSALDPATDTTAAGDTTVETKRVPVSFLSPMSAGLAMEHGIETARRVLGWDAPRGDCFEAVLSEAESSLPVGPARSPEDDSGPLFIPTGRLPWADSLSPPNQENRTRRRRRTRSTGRWYWPDRRERKRAKRLLSLVRRRLERIERLTGASLLHTSRSACSLPASTLLDRFRSIQQQERAIRVLEARLVYHFFHLNLPFLLWPENSRESENQFFGVSDRTLTNLYHAGLAFEWQPPVADFYTKGKLGLQQVIAFAYWPTSLDVETWILRAQRLTTRQFRREVHFFDRISRFDPSLWKISLSNSLWAEMEAVFTKKLFKMGWSIKSIDHALQDRGLVPPTGSSLDPAENPVVMRRVEVLLDMLLLETCASADKGMLEEGEEAIRTLKTLSTPGRHHRFTVWVKDCVSEHWNRIRRRIRNVCGRLPSWAVATLTFRAALEEWGHVDSGHIPTERKILDRDEYRCQVPGCSSRRNLEVHHITFRSRGGSNQARNLVTLCHSHHQHALHGGRVRVSGIAPHALTWEIGCSTTAPPRWIYRGDRQVRRRLCTPQGAFFQPAAAAS